MAKRAPHHQQNPSRKARATALNSITKGTQLPTPKSLRRWKSTTTHHAPGFWDLLISSGLSISLTKRALQEFDRRTAEKAPQVPIQRPRGHITLCYTDITSTSKGVTKSTGKTHGSGRSSAYDANFMSLLISNGIDRPQREVRPANYDQLRDRLAKRRDSLSPSRFSEFDYKNFLAAIDNAHDEGQVMTDVFSVVKGSKVCPSTANRPCNNWMPLISDALVTPQPDFYYGERQKPQDADLRKALDGLIVPSRSSEAPFLPNFLVEVKAPGASAEIARRQAVYDGALAARAMHHLQAYGAEEAYDENAYAFTSTYIDGKLEIFAHHMTPSDQPGKQPSHHTVSIGRWMLDDDIHAFFRGITAFRNLRDLAQGFRESFIAGANSRMDLLTPEVRDQKIAQASTRMKEISDRNIAVESFPAAAQSPLTNTRGVQTPLEQDGDTTNEAVVFPAGRAETRATGRTELLKKALTKGKHDHQLKLTKGPKGRKKPGKKPLKG